MAGAPFDAVERLGTPNTTSAAREVLARRDDCSRTRLDVERFFESRERLLSEGAFRSVRTALRLNQPPVGVSGEQPSFFTNFAAATLSVQTAESHLDRVLETEIQVARLALWEASRNLLPRLLVFSPGSVAELMAELMQPAGADFRPLSRRTSRLGERERHLLLYLQRVAAKNDAFSEFGPTGWGKVDQTTAALDLHPHPGISAREVFLERWTAHTIARVMNEDTENFVEMVPRQNPNGRLDGSQFILTDSFETIQLAPSQLDLVRRCDGATPIHALGAPLEEIRELLERKILRCEVEVPALEPHAFYTLRDDVQKWRPGPARDKWLSILQPIAELPAKLAGTQEVKERRKILEEAESRLAMLGASRKTKGRFLYSAANPIGEECLRECDFSIGEELINEVAAEAEPWIDLWRDSYAFVAARVAAGLRGVLEKMPMRDEAVPFPAFLRACQEAHLSLTGPGLVALAQIAFQEVKAGFREMMKANASRPEYELTRNDCHFVRRNFEYPKFDEYTYPSADLQLSARSVAAVAAGDYQWVLAELHPPAALLHHGAYWSCPDYGALRDAFVRTINGKPTFYFGFFAADFTAHTTVRLFDALPDFSYFVAPLRGNPAWRCVPPAQVEVYIDAKSGDVGLRKADNREPLGSFARAWLISLGFHPFQFGMAPHMPRLRCGKVVVQRRTWTVALDELGPGNYTGISRDLVLAVERLRAQRDLPRYLYIRPTEQALRRSGAEGRDKDTKPVFVDLESYLFMEIFQRWLTKAGELEITEMLPDPAHLLWNEPEGRHTFELRTLIVPAS